MFRIALVIAAAAFCWSLMHWIGRWPMLGTWAVGMTVACAGAALLVRTAELGEITWKNRIAGVLLPWGYGLGAGKLPLIAMFSWIGWVLIGVAVASQPGWPSLTRSEPGRPAGAWYWLLYAGWAINAAVIGLWVTTLVLSRKVGHANGQSLLKPTMLLIVATGASIALHVAGYTRSAALVAACPLLVVAVFVGAFIGLIVVASKLGKPVRWN